ncbi:MAG TPA: dihydroorotase, partial [Mucilaginibacter sp.]|nr:dihydroorotase [Mucilaginibacter sp.]
MNLLIKSATISDPGSPFYQQVADVLIEKGHIIKIAKKISSDFETFDARGKDLLPGFFDLNCNIGELGLETKEDLKTGTHAAAAGGFTGVALMPNTIPPVHSKAEIEYLMNRAKNNLVDVYPLGTLSHKREGKDLAEMYDMRASGAVAFSDGLHPIQSSGLMVKALQYVKAFDGVVIQIPDDTSIAKQGLMHEGIISTRLGLQGKPMIAEELIVARDIKLARYTDSHIHFTGVSSPKSIEYIRRAKESGLNVSCSVTP